MLERNIAVAVGQRRRDGIYQRMLLVIGGWALLIGGIQLYAWQQMIHPLELIQDLVQLCHTHPVGPLFFIGAAALSPLLLIPAALLGSVAGLCFGPVLGVALTLIGCNLSATFTYSLGRFSTRGAGGSGRLLERYGPHLRRNAFLNVILLRLSFLPYDPVNYLIGLLHIRWVSFIVANTIGSLPGVIAIVLAGAALEGIDQGLPMLDPRVLIGSALLLLLSLGLAIVLRRRAKNTMP
ncbi:MAG: VTT domain-containing protein [Chloroflexales bacterium]|nr:VTT domain-containing protein [Chloroflexales bacterium]